MRAILLSIGDELTLGQTIDTNSQWLSAALAQRAILAIEHRTIADDRAALADAVRQCVSRCDVLVLTGGLGPTDDDVTREALGDVASPGEALVADANALTHLEQWFGRRSHAMPAINARQAMRPGGFRMLPNPNGTAPGLYGEIQGCRVFALPGPPREMQPMFGDHVLPALPLGDGDVLLTARVQEFGMGESVAAERLGDLMRRDRNPLVGTTASQSIVSARIRARGEATWACEEVKVTIERVHEAWQPYAFAENDQTLAAVTGRLLKDSNMTLATAESCTGGWLGKAIVDCAGSSAWYLGGWITYADRMKEANLGVPPSLLRDHGAVSREVARAMAEGAQRASAAGCALAITGIAGPDGGTSTKPVGTVFIALSGTSQPQVRCFEFPGEREVVRDRAVKAALQMLRFSLLGVASTSLIWETTPGRE